ncbi:TetR family transcriptional regulator C-terminal domain-containing protein [Streptomyces sp. NBC_01445]|uniref:TetR family transcriptional regulator C-terminal domain-containing protein n=1 Tax=Streptomyces sp. NBC_01445 TaxID=2903869 RepID=UPI002DD9ED8E|nr:TetR family transcriptional regulator C-terminal domain-containing protein [Streptomyces sp. NBC_01445]WSE11003.1 TetR family transcriptional regulator C-terminal domain-containing protein [Streptomyces sp. NBC_01445]
MAKPAPRWAPPSSAGSPSGRARSCSGVRTTPRHARAAASVGDRGGPSALRQLCLEVVPLDDMRLQEVCVVIAFADRAQYDARMAATYRMAVGLWREQMRMYLRQARPAGEITTGRPDTLVVAMLQTTLVGLQTAAVAYPGMSAARQTEILDGLLGT